MSVANARAGFGEPGERVAAGLIHLYHIPEIENRFPILEPASHLYPALRELRHRLAREFTFQA
jgi:hypothetical protein